MNKKKKIILFTIVATLIVLIIFVAVVVLIGKDSNGDNYIYGKWVAKSSEVFDNGLITSYVEIIEDKYLVISKSQIKICYIVDNKDICKKVKYSIANNNMVIEDNDLYLSGEEEIILEENRLTMKYNLDGNELYSLIHFERE